MTFYFSDVTFNLFLVFVFLVVNLRQVSLCKNANPIEVAWRDLLCAYDDLVKWFYGCFCNDEIDEMINWPWCFFSAQDSFQKKRDDWFWCFDSDEVYVIDG
ncbi:hypothetical protein [Escherichia coli]|uniref:hypothetical protein n=1 Tax=Escherichia coli TaxID=562 RepID=UPI00111CD3ED|nr:hypothetical protein [Escherichia coli]UIM77115.1 hypothetical protein K8B87_02320 [Escherichia coli O99:H6]